MKEHNGNEARNARINISYSGKKPKVNFSYPVKKKDSHTQGSMAFPIFIIWIIINIPFMVYLQWQDSELLSAIDRPFNESSEYNMSDYSEFLDYYLQPERIDYYHNFYKDMEKNPLKEVLVLFFNLKVLLFIIYILGVPAIIYFPFKKKWDSKFPDYQAFITPKKYVKFTQKDIKKDAGEIYIELPILNNVICDFKATKDFSKYLKEFEIREHNFKYKRLGKKKIQNEDIWYSRWYFDKEPEKGFLEIVFR